jgi:hypothetical protein
MRCRHVGQEGRSVGNSCGNPLARIGEWAASASAHRRVVAPRVLIVGLNTDMIATGLVKSLAHPGGNITGISLLSPELEGKRQDILIEAVPGARRMAMLADANATGPQQLKALQDADSGTDRLRGHLLSGAFIPGSSHSKARPARGPGGFFSGESKMPKPLSIEVVRRAYELWQQAGEPEGRDWEFYLEAERQLTEAAEKDPPKDE